MNRILMAAARGARLQGRWASRKEFVNVHAVYLSDHTVEYRIHPDDEHLAYGPVSTALREAALSPDGMGTGNVPYIHFSLKMCGEESVWWAWASKNERSLFLLILSEALCDDGL